MSINTEQLNAAQLTARMQAYGILFDEFTLMKKVNDQKEQDQKTYPEHIEIDYENAAVYCQRLDISSADKPFVLGDAHNKPESQALFERHLQKNNWLGNEHFPSSLDEPDKNKLSRHVKLIFLGDFFHRGKPGDCDLAFLLHILTLKVHNFSQVLLCKGNHEDIRMCSPVCYPSEAMQAIQDIPSLQMSLEKLFQVLPDMVVSCKESGASFLGLHGTPEPDLPSWLPRWLQQSNTPHFTLLKGTPIALSQELQSHLENLLEKANKFSFSREELVNLLPKMETFITHSQDSHFAVPASPTSSLKSPLPRDFINQIWPLLYLDTLYKKPYQILPGQTEALAIALQRQRDESTPMSCWGRLGEIYKHNFDTYHETGPYCSASTLLAIKMTLSLSGIYLELVIRGHDHVLSYNEFILTLPASPEPGSNEEQVVLQLRASSPDPKDWNFRLIRRFASEKDFIQSHRFRMNNIHDRIPRSYSPTIGQNSEQEDPPHHSFSEPSLRRSTSSSPSASPESLTTTTTTTTTTQASPNVSPEPLPVPSPNQDVATSTTSLFPFAPQLEILPIPAVGDPPKLKLEDPNTYPPSTLPSQLNPQLQPQLFGLPDTQEIPFQPPVPWLPLQSLTGQEEWTPREESPSTSESFEPSGPREKSFFEIQRDSEAPLFDYANKAVTAPSPPPPAQESSQEEQEPPKPITSHGQPSQLFPTSKAFQPYIRTFREPKPPKKSPLSNVFTYKSPIVPTLSLEGTETK